MWLTPTNVQNMILNKLSKQNQTRLALTSKRYSSIVNQYHKRVGSRPKVLDARGALARRIEVAGRKLAAAMLRVLASHRKHPNGVPTNNGPDWHMTQARLGGGSLAEVAIVPPTRPSIKPRLSIDFRQNAPVNYQEASTDFNIVVDKGVYKLLRKHPISLRYSVPSPRAWMIKSIMKEALTMYRKHPLPAA
jgi:hypothetical protein